MRYLLGLSLVAAALFIVFARPAGADTPLDPPPPSVVEPTLVHDGGSANAYRLRLLDLTNQYRVAHGRAPLFLNDALSNSAQDYAEQMGRHRFFGHDAPNGSSMTTRIESKGYSGWLTIGENLGAGYKTPEEVFSGWLASPTHRENILNPNYREIGIGFSVIPGSQYKDYWVETFGARPGVVAARNITKPSFVLGFAHFQRANPSLIGDALEDVWHLGQSGTSTMSIQRTTNGVLLWLKPVNRMVFLTENQAYSFQNGRIEALSDAERSVFSALAPVPTPEGSGKTAAGDEPAEPAHDSPEPDSTEITGDDGEPAAEDEATEPAVAREEAGAAEPVGGVER